MITPKNVIQHELIGLTTEVCESTNKANLCLKGKVVDETKNMIVIKSKDKAKRIQKKGNRFLFDLPDGKKVKINGERILMRPEDRIKLKVKKW